MNSLSEQKRRLRLAITAQSKVLIASGVNFGEELQVQLRRVVGEVKLTCEVITTVQVQIVANLNSGPLLALPKPEMGLRC